MKYAVIGPDATSRPRRARPDGGDPSVISKVDKTDKSLSTIDNDKHNTRRARRRHGVSLSTVDKDRDTTPVADKTVPGFLARRSDVNL